MKDIGHATLWYLARILATLAYFFPTIAASRYQHPKRSQILILNAVLGWTVVGWVIALRWALKPLGSKE
jgi:hypothetical protein